MNPKVTWVTILLLILAGVRSIILSFLAMDLLVEGVINIVTLILILLALACIIAFVGTLRRESWGAMIAYLAAEMDIAYQVTYLVIFFVGGISSQEGGELIMVTIVGVITDGIIYLLARKEMNRLIALEVNTEAKN